MDRKSIAYDYLKQKIVDNEFLPGSPIRESDVAGTLNMSRAPVREALRELEMEGVVVSYPSRGSFVSAITPYDVEEIYELRMLLEVWALEKGFSRITTEDLDRFEMDFNAPNEPFNWEFYHDTDRAFHQMIIDKSGSRRVAMFMTMLNAQVERVRRFSARDSGRGSQERTAEHLHIIECIRSGDLEVSKEALCFHLRNVANSAIEAWKMMDYQTHSRR